MSNKQTGWVLFIAALGMMFGLVAADMRKLATWEEIKTISFVADFLGHLSVVIAAFVGGRLMPEYRRNKLTRATDSTFGDR